MHQKTTIIMVTDVTVSNLAGFFLVAVQLNCIQETAISNIMWAVVCQRSWDSWSVVTRLQDGLISCVMFSPHRVQSG